MKKSIIPLCLALGSLFFADASAQNPPITPAWAFRHVVWEDSLNTRTAATELVEQYFKHDIPVEGIIIDSPWATAYNDFNWDSARYPDHKEMIAGFKEKGVKVILWTTGNLNIDAYDTPNKKSALYDEAVSKGYGVNDSKPSGWWKGTGIHIDFTDPKATAWWYSQLDRVFIDGVYGWKVDQGEWSFGDIIKTSKGLMSNEQFRPYYYSAMYDYAVSRSPMGIIIARPHSHQGGYFAAVDKMNMGWCGDFEGDWIGMKEQIKDIYKSSRRGYGSISCEVGGFRGMRSDKQQLIRYAQFGSMCAAMISGGLNGAFTNHLPWWHDKETEDIYRFCVVLHDQLVPYMFSTVVDAHFRGGSLIRNASFEEESHQLGDYLFTKVITSADNVAEFKLPGEGEWIDFFSGERYAAGTHLKKTYPLNEFPLFVKAGAIIPMDIDNDVAGLGDASYAGRRTIVIYPNGVSRRVMHLPLGDGIEYMDCEVGYDEKNGKLEVFSESEEKFTIVLKDVPSVRRIKNVQSWSYDKYTRELRIDFETKDAHIKVEYR